MNKRAANILSTESKLSIGELRAIIAGARWREGMSTVNPQFTMAQVCDIYEGGLAGRDDAEILKGMRYDPYKNCDVPSRDSLMIRNILRDCA